MPVPMPETTERACRHCGCTEMDACPGGCAWVSADECSACRPDLVHAGRARVLEVRKPGKAAP
jgi:hypothetical protein